MRGWAARASHGCSAPRGNRGASITSRGPRPTYATSRSRRWAQSACWRDRTGSTTGGGEPGSRECAIVVCLGLEHDPEKHSLRPRPDGGVPVFPRDKPEAFARGSFSNKKIKRDDGFKKRHPPLVGPS